MADDRTESMKDEAAGKVPGTSAPDERALSELIEEKVDARFKRWRNAAFGGAFAVALLAAINFVLGEFRDNPFFASGLHYLARTEQAIARNIADQGERSPVVTEMKKLIDDYAMASSVLTFAKDFYIAGAGQPIASHLCQSEVGGVLVHHAVEHIVKERQKEGHLPPPARFVEINQAIERHQRAAPLAADHYLFRALRSLTAQVEEARGALRDQSCTIDAGKAGAQADALLFPFFARPGDHVFFILYRIKSGEPVPALSIDDFEVFLDDEVKIALEEPSPVRSSELKANLSGHLAGRSEDDIIHLLTLRPLIDYNSPFIGVIFVSPCGGKDGSGAPGYGNCKKMRVEDLFSKRS